MRTTREFILKVYLQPKSSKNEIVGPYRDGIKVKVTAPPVGGKANESLIRFLAEEVGVPPSSIEILKGHHAREKLLRISGNVNQEWLKKYSKIGQPFLQPKGCEPSPSHEKGRQS